MASVSPVRWMISKYNLLTTHPLRAVHVKTRQTNLICLVRIFKCQTTASCYLTFCQMIGKIFCVPICSLLVLGHTLDKLFFIEWPSSKSDQKNDAKVSGKKWKMLRQEFSSNRMSKFLECTVRVRFSFIEQVIQGMNKKTIFMDDLEYTQAKDEHRNVQFWLRFRYNMDNSKHWKCMCV